MTITVSAWLRPADTGDATAIDAKAGQPGHIAIGQSDFVTLTRRTMIATTAALLAGCRASPSGSTPIVIGYQRNGLLLLARTRGAVDAGLVAGGQTAAQWLEFPSGPPMMEAMRAGAIAFGAVGDSPPIFAQAALAPIVYAGVQPLTGAGEGLLVPATSRVTTVGDLRGRRVAYTKGTSAHLLMAKALRKAGLTFGDIVAVELNPSEAVAAFAAGSIDAWATWDPYLALGQRDQKARILVSGSQLPASDAFYLANADFARNRPNELRELIRLLRIDAVWSQTHADQLVALMAKGSGLPIDIVTASLRRGPLALEPVTSAVIARQQGNADIYADLGIIPQRIDIAGAVWRDGGAPR
jgi:sulfonate transport system substrate-binding protein